MSPAPPANHKRRVNNIMVGALLFLLIAAGVWMFNAIDAARKAQECLESRRFDCRIIENPR